MELVRHDSERGSRYKALVRRRILRRMISMMELPDNLKSGVIHLEEKYAAGFDDPRALTMFKKARADMRKNEDYVRSRLLSRAYVDGRFDLCKFHHDLPGAEIVIACLDLVRRHVELPGAEGASVLGELNEVILLARHVREVHRHAFDAIGMVLDDLEGVGWRECQMLQVNLVEAVFEMMRSGLVTAKASAALLAYDEAELAALPDVCERERERDRWGGRGVETVLWNLVRNALLYSVPPHALTIRGLVAQGGTLAGLSIENRGFGIREEHAERIFECGFRSAEALAASKGTGIGLFVSRRLVEAHGGRLTVSSEEVEPGIRLTRATALFPVAPK